MDEHPGGRGGSDGQETTSVQEGGGSFGIRTKLVLLFTIIKIIPLVLLAWFAWSQAEELGETVADLTNAMLAEMNATVRDAGNQVVEDAVKALDDKARETLERLTTDTARAVADFLYERDHDILYAASLPPNEAAYRAFLQSHRRAVIKHGPFKPTANGSGWVPVEQKRAAQPRVEPKNPENRTEFHSRPPLAVGAREDRPLYLEMTFVGLDGRERVKVTSSDLMDPALKDVSDRLNTFVKAERYFDALRALEPGAVHVSDVIGAYVGSRIIGPYTRARTNKAGQPFEPEKSAWAGTENPVGRRFRGLVRWATPVVEDGAIIGWVTLALDHRHIMEFTDHLVPDERHMVAIPNPTTGNYAFMLDDKGRTITHPRNYYIVGYDPETGEPVAPWFEKAMYDEWQASGLSVADYIDQAPKYHEQSTDKKPALAQVKAGTIAADCRFLNFAPQCTGWRNLTAEGGFGSFRIFWSGLWKLNTAAPIPYFTGQYGETPRGFGIITFGANVEDFHMAATASGRRIATLLETHDLETAATRESAASAIVASVAETTRNLTLSTLVMVAVVVMVALWLAAILTRRVLVIANGMERVRAGERNIDLPPGANDELGALTRSFNEMVADLSHQEAEVIKLSQAVEQSSATVVITNTDGAIEYVNPSFERTTGYSREEAIGQNPRILKSGETPPEEYVQMWATITSGSSWTGEFHNRRRDGSLYWEAATIAPIRDKAGTTTHFLAVKDDITDRKEAEIALRDSEARLRAILDNSPAVIYLKDLEGRYLFINRKYAELFHIPTERMVGRTDFDIFPDAIAEAFQANDRQVMETEEPIHVEEVAPLDDGPHDYLSVKFPLYDSEGTLSGTCGISTDISDLKRTQAELERSNEELEQFAYVSSHDLKEPLRMVTSYLQILERQYGEKLDANANELIDYAVDGARRMNQLITDLLQFSQVKTRGQEFEAIPVTRSLDDALKNLAVTIENEGAEIIVKADNPIVLGDPHQLTQLFQNLIGNALKYRNTEEPPRIQVAANRGGLEWRFSVSDNGIGIEEKYFERIFTIFQRLHGRGEYSGTGIGLAICKRIVERHGGRIWVESTPGAGTTFSFTLPAID